LPTVQGPVSDSRIRQDDEAGSQYLLSGQSHFFASKWSGQSQSTVEDGQKRFLAVLHFCNVVQFSPYVLYVTFEEKKDFFFNLKF
jgi:hypothetical protein